MEINSSFHRHHAFATYKHWAQQTPRGFSFAVKLPRSITHEERLRAARRPLEEFLASLRGLGRRLGPLLVQLPPSLVFEARVARTFFALLRACHAGPVVCEPRHLSWFEPGADQVLVRHRIGRVAADPAVIATAAIPGGWPGIAYYRLHGSPHKYWSIYEPERLKRWAQALAASPRGTLTWCVFDNTAAGGALGNALETLKLLRHGRRVRVSRTGPEG